MGQLDACLDKAYKKVYTVEEHHVVVYTGRSNQTIINAGHLNDLLHSSILTSSLAVSIMNVKYVNGLPLYRSIQEFLRNDTTSPNR